MGSGAGARNFQCCREIVFNAGFQYRARVLTPICIVEIDSKKVASVIEQKRIDTGSDLTPEMPENDVVGDGRKQAMATLAAFYSRLFANAATPFICADGGIPRFFRRLAYPADR